MAKTNSNVEVRLKNVRLAFGHIFKAQAPKPDKETGKVGKSSFNCSFIVEGGDKKNINIVEDAIEESMKLMWPDKQPKIRADRRPWKDGDDYEYDGYPGNMILSARSYSAPKIVHSKKDENGRFVVLDDSDGVIYNGCYVNGIVNIWCMDDPEWGKRVNCSLEVVQFYADGDEFSGRSNIDPDEALAGMEGKVDEDEDPRDNRGRRTERDARGSRGRDDERQASSGRRRDRDEEEERPARSRRDDEGDDRPSRSDRDVEDDRPARGRAKDRDEEDERPARSRPRDVEDDRRPSRAREPDDRRSSSRDRERAPSRSARDDEERPRGRSSSQDDEPARGSRRSSQSDLL